MRELELEQKQSKTQERKKKKMEEQSNNNNGDLETIRHDRAVWLMKCPPVVTRTLQSQSESPSPIAKVILSIDPLLPNEDPNSSQFTMELGGDSSGNVPKCYSLKMSEDVMPMCVFAQPHANPGNISVEGKVLNRFDMEPHNEHIGTYGKFCRERTNKYKKEKKIKVLEGGEPTMRRIIPVIKAKTTKGPGPVKPSDTKRTRRGRTEMEGAIFNLFERQPNWTLRQLIQETDQPEQFLKEILKDLCIYNNKGANQGTYDLKPEYKKSTDETNPE